MHKSVFIFILLLAETLAFGQGSVDSVLASILANNKTLESNTQFLESKRLQYRTGLTPDNPIAEYDYLIGTPANAGNQTDITIIQSFDFPTAYIKKGKVANAQVSALEFEANIQRQAILFEAKILCIELIYLNKRISQLETRVINARKVHEALDIKLQNEEINAIGANKAKLMLLNVNSGFQILESEREQLLFRLTQMNGGLVIELDDKDYAVLPDVPQVDKLLVDIEAVDPVLKLYEQQIVISELQVALSRAMALPKLETGYRYQSILGQTFNGVHVGISIPLWEHKNSVKQSKAYALFTEIELEEHRINQRFKIRELHKQYEVLNESTAAYEEVLSTLSSEELLQKSLELGQISFIEFALEIEYYYNALDQYLQLEKTLHLTIAQLFKHKL